VICAQQEVAQYDDLNSMHGLQNMQRAMLNQSLPQQGMPDADYIWGGDHIGYSGMGSYGDLPGSGPMCVWDPVESEGMGLSRSKSASRTATEDEQRKHEVDELARDIDALNKKITAASMSREHIIAEWAMIAYEATHLVDRQLALINVLKCTIHQVGEEAQTLVETYHMCVDDSDEDDMAMPMRSDLQDKYDMKYEWNHSAMMNSLGHSNSYHLDSFTSLSKDSLMPGIGSLGSIGSLGPSKKPKLYDMNDGMSSHQLLPSASGVLTGDPTMDPNMLALRPANFPTSELNEDEAARGSSPLTGSSNAMKSLKKLVLSKEDKNEME